MNLEKIRALVQRRLSQRYPSGRIPAAEARELVVEVVRIATHAATCLPSDERRLFLAALAERLATLPLPWD